MKRIIILFAVFLPLFMAGQQPIIIDHTCIDLNEIPAQYIDSAKANLWIGYGHTSHGRHLTSGMDALDDYFTDGTYAWSHDGGPGELHLFEGSGYSPGYLRGDLGYDTWDDDTRVYLDENPGCNVIIWAWCGDVWYVDLQSWYLDPMNQLESEYPDVQFVYMTGHLEGWGVGGNLYLANQQIRDYCIANNKILYDFADIEKYSPDADTNYQEYYADAACDYQPPGGGTANWANNWLAANPGHELTGISQWCPSCAHSVSLNCTKKGIAAWYLWARLAGWSSGNQITSNFNLQDTAYISSAVDIIYAGNASPSAAYYWDFDGANVISGSGQGPYTVQWTSIGDKTVSLYVEESGYVSDTTTNEVYIVNNSNAFTSCFAIQMHGDTLKTATDTICPGTAADIIYTGNAPDSATYYWDFGYATVLSGSGQGPYMVQWPYGGFAAVSLYVEESNLASDTTTNDLYVFFDPIFTILPYPNDTVSVNDTIVLTADIESVSYLWSTGETTPSIHVFSSSPPENMGGDQGYWLLVTDENGCSSTDSIVVRFDMPVNISDFQNEIEIKVYPNPFSDELNIELEIADQGQYILEVIDNIGRPVIRELRHFEPGTQKIHLNMNSHSPGVYILSARSNKGMIGLKKILKFSNRG